MSFRKRDILKPVLVVTVHTGVAIYFSYAWCRGAINAVSGKFKRLQ
jgi:hypothetical protein